MKKFFMVLASLVLMAAIIMTFKQVAKDIDGDNDVTEQYENVDYEALGIDGQLWRELLIQTKRDNKLIDILKNIDLYSNDMISLALKVPEARDYVAGYPQHMESDTRPEDIKLTDDELEGGVPLFLQWDTRWGYDNYGGKPMGITGCGPTCLSMVAVALTGNESYNPLAVAQLAEENGYYVPGSGSSWDLVRSGSENFGITWRELGLSETEMKSVLDNGGYIICSMLPGDFTTTGHFIVIDGYTGEKFTVKDPNSPSRSDKKWSYDTLSGQIAAMWAYGAY